LTRGALLLGAIFAAGCAARPAPAPATPAPAAPPPSASGELVAPQFTLQPSKAPYSGGDGSAIDNAVVVNARNESEGIRMESEWIFHYNGRFRKISSGLVAQEGRHFDVIRVELSDHSEKAFFFDISAFFGIDEP
jgi:hypothetical protein